ncbi:microtubule-associated protein futsch-like [Hetaerina americana]|uniref:microtubule-associated protein futsch-like n=1 Tax=Hetaerina americana TaxID=62018 RepID=UPI003A7F3FB2
MPKVIEVLTSTLDSSCLTGNGKNSTNQTEAMQSVSNVSQKAKKVVSDKQSEESVTTNESKSDSILETKSIRVTALKGKCLFEVNPQIEGSTVNSIENSALERDELETPLSKKCNVSRHNANNSMLGADTPKTMRNTPHTAKNTKKLSSPCISTLGTPSVNSEVPEVSMSSSTGKSSANTRKSGRVQNKWNKSICSVKNMPSEYSEKDIKIIVIPPTPDGNLESPKKEETCISTPKQNILFSTLKKSAVKVDGPNGIGNKSKMEVIESLNESLEDNGSFMEIKSSKKISRRKKISNLIDETCTNKSASVRVADEMNSSDENIGEVSDVDGGQRTITNESISRRGSLRSRKSLNSSNVNEQSSIFQRSEAGCQSDETKTPLPSDEEYASWFSQRNSLASTVGSKAPTPVLKRNNTHGPGTPNNVDDIRKVMQTPLIINVRDTPPVNSLSKLGGIANGAEEKKFSPHIRRSNRKSIRSIGTPCFAASIYNRMKSHSYALEEEENNMSSTQEMNLENADFLSDVTNISCTGDGETDSLMQTSSLLLDESDMLDVQGNQAKESVMKSSWTSTPAVGNSARKKLVNFGTSICSKDLGKQAPHTPTEGKAFHSGDIASPDSSSGMILSLIGEPGDVKESIKKNGKRTRASRSFQMPTFDVSCTSGGSDLESSYNSALDNTVTMVNTPSLFDQDRSDISARSLRSCKSVLSYKSNITPIAKKQGVVKELVKSGKKANGERQDLDDLSIGYESTVNDKASRSSSFVNESLSVVNGGNWTITNESISRRGSLRSRKSLNSSNVNEQSSIFQKSGAGCQSDETKTPVPSDEEYASWFSQRNSLASTVGSKAPTPVLKRNDTHDPGTPNNVDDIRKVMQTPLIINMRDTPPVNSLSKLGGIANGAEEKKFSPHIRRSNRKSIRSIGTPCFAPSIYNQMKSYSYALEEEENNMSSTQEMNLENADFLSDVTNISCTGDGETDSLMQTSSLLLDESDMLDVQGNQAKESVMKSSWTSTPAVGNSGKQAPHTPTEGKAFHSGDIASPDSSSGMILSLIGEPGDVKESIKKSGKRTPSDGRHNLNSCTSDISIENLHSVVSSEFDSDNSNVSEKNLSLEGKRSLRSCKSLSGDTAMTQSVSENFGISINDSSTPELSSNVSVYSTQIESRSGNNYWDEEGEKKDISTEKPKRKSSSRKSSVNITKDCITCPSTPDYSESIISVLATPAAHILHKENLTESVFKELQSPSLRSDSPISPSRETSTVSSKEMFTPASNTSRRSTRSKRNSSHNISYETNKSDNMTSKENTFFFGSLEGFSSTVENEAEMDSQRFGAENEYHDESGERITRSRKNSMNETFKITPEMRKIVRKSSVSPLTADLSSNEREMLATQAETSGKRKSKTRESSMPDSIKVTPQIRKITRKSVTSPATPDYSDSMRDMLATPAVHILQPVEKHLTESVNEEPPSLKIDFPSSATRDSSRLNDKSIITPASNTSRRSSKGGRRSSFHVSESTKTEVPVDTTYFNEDTSLVSSSGEITSVEEVEETSVDSQEEGVEMVNPNGSGKRKSLSRKSSMAGSFKITPLITKVLRKSVHNPSTPDYGESICNLLATPSVNVVECDEENSAERVKEELQQPSSLRSVSPSSASLEAPLSVRKMFTPTTHTSGRSTRSGRNSFHNVSDGSIKDDAVISRENTTVLGSPEELSCTLGGEEELDSGRVNVVDGNHDESGKRKTRGRKSSVNASFKITPQIGKIARKSVTFPATPDYSDSMRDMLATPAVHILQPVEKHLTESVNEEPPSLKIDFPSSATRDSSRLNDKSIITPASNTSRRSSKGGRRSSFHVSESTKTEVPVDTTYFNEDTSLVSSSGEITSVEEVEETSVDSQEEGVEMVNPNGSGKRKSLSRKSSMAGSFKITPLITKVLRKSVHNPSTPDYGESICNLLATPSVNVVECDEENSAERVKEELQQPSSLRSVSPSSASLEAPLSVRKMFTPTTHTSGRSTRSGRNSFHNVSDGSIKDDAVISREKTTVLGSPEELSCTLGGEEELDSGRVNVVDGNHDESGKRKTRGRKSSVNASFKITPQIGKIARKSVTFPATPDYSDSMRDMLATPAVHILQPVEKHLTESVNEEPPSLKIDFPSSATRDSSRLNDKSIITPASNTSRRSSKGGRRSSFHVSESTKTEVPVDTTYFNEDTSLVSSSGEITSVEEVEETSVDSQEEGVEMVNPNGSGKRKSLSRKSSMAGSFKITPLITKVLRKSVHNPSTPDYSESICNLLATPSVNVVECDEENSTERVKEELQQPSSLRSVSPRSASLEAPASVKKMFTPTTHTSGRSKRPSRNSFHNVSNGSIKDDSVISRENTTVLGSPEELSCTVEGEEEPDSGRLNVVDGNHDESGKRKTKGRKSSVNASFKVTPQVGKITRRSVTSPDYSVRTRDIMATPSDNARPDEDTIFSESRSMDSFLSIQRCDMPLSENCVVPSLVDKHTDSFMSDKSIKSPGLTGGTHKLVDCPNDCNTSSGVTSTEENAPVINTSMVYSSEVEEELVGHGQGLDIYVRSENKKSKGRTSAVFQENINCVKHLLAKRSPISRYSDFQGIKSLFNHDSPHSSYLDVSGLKEIFESHANSPVDVIPCSKSMNSVVNAENVLNESSLPNSNPQTKILTSLEIPVVLVSKLSPEHLASYIRRESNSLSSKSRHSRRCTKQPSNVSSQRVTRRTKEAETHNVNSGQPELIISPVGKENKSKKGLKSHREGDKSVVAVKHLLVNAELNSLPVATTASVILKSNLRNITGQKRLKKNVQFDGLLEEMKVEKLEHNEDGIVPTKRRSSRKSTSKNTTDAIFSNQKLPSKASKNPEIGHGEDGGENDVVSTRRGHLRKRVITRVSESMNSDEEINVQDEAANDKMSAISGNVAGNGKESAVRQRTTRRKKADLVDEETSSNDAGTNEICDKFGGGTKEKAELVKGIEENEEVESLSLLGRQTRRTRRTERPDDAIAMGENSNEDTALEPEKPVATRKKQESFIETIIKSEKSVAKNEAAATRRKGRSNEDTVLEPEKPVAARKKQDSCTETITEPKKSAAKKEAAATRRKGRSNEDTVLETEKPMARRKKLESCTETIIEPEKLAAEKEARATRRKGRSNEDKALETEKPMARRKKLESCTETIIEPEKLAAEKEARATRRKGRSNEDKALETEKPMAKRKKLESCTETIIEPEKPVAKKEATATRRKGRSNKDTVLEHEKPMARRKKLESCTETIIEPKKLAAEEEARATRRKGRSNEDKALETEKPVAKRKKLESCTETIIEPKKLEANKEAAATRRKGRSNEDKALEPEKPVAKRKKQDSIAETIIDPDKKVAKEEAVDQVNEREKHGDAAVTTSGRFTRRGKVVNDESKDSVAELADPSAKGEKNVRKPVKTTDVEKWQDEEKKPKGKQLRSQKVTANGMPKADEANRSSRRPAVTCSSKDKTPPVTEEKLRVSHKRKESVTSLSEKTIKRSKSSSNDKGNMHENKKEPGRVMRKR